MALAAEAGDPVAREVLAESGRRLGQGLAVVIDLLNPERIVIGSVFARCHAFLEPAMQGGAGKKNACRRRCAVARLFRRVWMKRWGIIPPWPSPFITWG